MTDLARRLLLPALCVLLVACWLGGGVTADDTAIDELLQLLALPVLLMGLLVMTADGASLPVRAGVAVALLVVLVPVGSRMSIICPTSPTIGLGVPCVGIARVSTRVV